MISELVHFCKSGKQVQLDLRLYKCSCYTCRHITDPVTFQHTCSKPVEIIPAPMAL